MIANRPKEQHAQALADYLPNGPLFEAKNINDSNFRQLLRGLAGELFTAQGYLVTLENEYFPDLTSLFISEWERALGIPDDCFKATGTLNERRRDVLVKLSALGVQTAADFVQLGVVYGIALTVTPLSDEDPLPAGISAAEARYISVVTGPNLVGNAPPYDVPFDLSVGEIVLRCLFDKQHPANCDMIYRSA